MSAPDVSFDALADPLAYHAPLRVAIHVLRATGSYQKEPHIPSMGGVAVTPKADPVAEVRAYAAHIILEYFSKYASNHI